MEGEMANEINLMKDFRHPNIVQYYGLYRNTDNILFLVTEFLVKGDLLRLLRDRQRRFSKIQLVTMAKDVVKGLMYLHAKKIVHRDLAARNLLVNENDTVKITDFGHSDKIYSLRDTPLPIRWSAPEALEGEPVTYTSDIYSLGCALYEIFTRGSEPWDTVMGNTEVRQLVCDRKKMPQPRECPDEVYAVMNKCWNFDPNERPSLQEILQDLDGIAPDNERPDDGIERNGQVDVSAEEAKDVGYEISHFDEEK
eukprot:TRINITY_DN9564_c0_g1_i6.p1 TRINITY_DN9564_c0_g1~~TRINITY_DN9564_c0_g1_i6.p1  ORF type:complete len:288 (+),score=53.26 TRINITY_DN9564_c0_g1_i6:107-865(+)